MKYDTKNSFGKRMVKESKIKEIGSSEYPEVDTTTDGTYVLKATVSDGVLTFEWVAEE